MSRWYTIHIKNEILFWFLLLSLLPLIVLTSVNYLYQKVQYEETAKEHLQIILHQKLKSIDEHIDFVSHEALILAETPNVKDAIGIYSEIFNTKGDFNSNIKLYEDYFSKIVVENQFYDLFLIDKEGNIVYSVKKESDLGTNLKTGKFSNSNLAKVFKNSIQLLETQLSDFEFYAPSNEDGAFVSSPVFGENGILGAVAVQIDKDKIIDIFRDSEGLGNTGEFFGARLDEFNRIISTTPLKNNKLSVKQEYQFPANKELPVYKAVNGAKGVGLSKDYVGDKIVAAWAYIPTLRWGVVIKVDLKEVLKPIAELRFYSIVVLFFVGLGIIVAILTAIKHIVEPIEKLTNGVKNFAKGKMETNVDIDIDNEIGELSRNFNDMASSLKTSQDTIQKYANELEQKVKIRTKELESAKQDIEKSNKGMKTYLNIVNKYVITSSTSLNGTITQVSQAFCDITGYTKEELIGKKHNIIRHPDMSAEVYVELWDTIKKGKTWQGEIKNQRKDGSYYWVESTVSPVYDDNGNIVEYTSIRQDITNKKKVEELSITDQLTKLYNRLKLEDVFNAEIERAERYDTPFSVILLDIDHFKSVNDTYGHDVGDETLKDVAWILKSSVRATDIVGRWGGEEFIVIASETTLEDAYLLAEKLRKKIEYHTFKVIGTKTSSFGVTEFIDKDTQESIVKRADDGLYEAKKSGRNCVIKVKG